MQQQIPIVFSEKETTESEKGSENEEEFEHELKRKENPIKIKYQKALKLDGEDLLNLKEMQEISKRQFDHWSKSGIEVRRRVNGKKFKNNPEYMSFYIGSCIPIEKIFEKEYEFDYLIDQITSREEFQLYKQGTEIDSNLRKLQEPDGKIVYVGNMDNVRIFEKMFQNLKDSAIFLCLEKLFKIENLRKRSHLLFFKNKGIDNELRIKFRNDETRFRSLVNDLLYKATSRLKSVFPLENIENIFQSICKEKFPEETKKVSFETFFV